MQTANYIKEDDYVMHSERYLRSSFVAYIALIGINDAMSGPGFFGLILEGGYTKGIFEGELEPELTCPGKIIISRKNKIKKIHVMTS